MRSWKLLIGLFLAFSLIVAACGNDDDEPGASDGDQTEQPVDEGAPEPPDDGDDRADEAEPPSDDEPAAMGELSLEGLTVGVAVVGTQHFWDREAFEGAVAEVERLGGTAVTTDGGRDNQVHADNHDVFLTRQVDAVITILGDAAVEPKGADAKCMCLSVACNSPWSWTWRMPKIA